MNIWAVTQQHCYISESIAPAVDEPLMHTSSSSVVFGCVISSPGNADASADQRKARRRAQSAIKSQLAARRIPDKDSVSVVEGVVLPSIKWGIESQSLAKPQRQRSSTV